MPNIASRVLRSLVLAAPVCGMACGDVSSTHSARIETGESALGAPVMANVTFHGDRQRTGWNNAEPALTPAAVKSPNFGHLWNSPELDSVVIGGKIFPPHLYASPLYADAFHAVSTTFGSVVANVVLVASSNGYAYAINASALASPAVPAGAILWRARLTTPIVNSTLDGGMPIGVLSTPFLDLNASPPRLYVTSQDAHAGWQAFALDASTGAVLPGWPAAINRTTVTPVNHNGTETDFDDPNVVSQRGALNLSHDGRHLYIPFGGYFDGATGWMVAIDTATAKVESAFSADTTNPLLNGKRFASGGMWAAGGPVIDAAGSVFATTGNGPTDRATTPHVWGQTLLGWSDVLDLQGTYTPFNYCAMDAGDADLGGSSPVSIDLEPGISATPHLLAFGSKQGNLYLIDRDHLPGSLTERPGCSVDSTTDKSLLSPNKQPQFNAVGPLNVFGQYTDDPHFENTDYAKSRSTPAYFRGSGGGHFLYLSGASKHVGSTTSVPPSIARIRIVTSPGRSAYLQIDKVEPTVAFINPGAAVVTANHGNTPVVWVLDENATRLASLTDPAAPHPILYAFDGTSLAPLWHSPVNELHIGGKYNTPVIAHGVVFVGTDRVQAYGLH